MRMALVLKVLVCVVGDHIPAISVWLGDPIAAVNIDVSPRGPGAA